MKASGFSTHAGGNRRLWGNMLCMVLVGLATFGVSYLFALRGVDPHHQGFMLKSAVDVSRGLALYKETFTQYGSLATYLLVPAIRLFGESVAAINAAACLAYALSGMLLYAILRRYANRLVAAVCPLVAIGMAAFYFWDFHPWPSVFALLFSLAAAYCMVRFIEANAQAEALGKAFPEGQGQAGKGALGRGGCWLALCGGATASMFWCRQPQGLSALAGGLMLLGLYGVGFIPSGKGLIKSLALFALGNLAVHGVLLGVLALQGAVEDWWIQCIVNALTFAAEPTAETAAARPDSIWKILLVGVDQNPRYDFVWRVLTYGTLACFLLLTAKAVCRAIRSHRREKPDAAAMGLIAFAAFALFNWPHYFPTLCYRHVFWSDYPMFGVLGAALYRGCVFLWERLRSRRPCGEGAKTEVLPSGAGQRENPAGPGQRRGKERLCRWVCGLAACCLMIALCAGNLLVRARIGKSRLMGGGHGADWHTIEQAEEDTTLRYHNDQYGYLNGLYLSPRETRFYDGLFSALEDLQARYPEKNIVNLTPNPLFSVFTSDNPHLRAFDNHPRDFGYPEQMDVTMAYIEENKPILISHEPVEGYRTAAYLTDYNGDYWRFAPFYVLYPEG